MKHASQLAKELRAAGADERELRALLPIAHDLRLLKSSSRADDKLRPRLVEAAGLGLLACAILIFISQAALPTSRLYAVQKFSDSVAVNVHPDYRAHLMMKRARQINQLVAQGANARTILATLADYSRVADAYKSMPHANYAAFDYCKSTLQQAAALAPPQVRNAIVHGLASLQST